MKTIVFLIYAGCLLVFVVCISLMFVLFIAEGPSDTVAKLLTAAVINLGVAMILHKDTR